MELGNDELGRVETWFALIIIITIVVAAMARFVLSTCITVTVTLMMLVSWLLAR